MLQEGRDDGVKGVGRTELCITPKRADPQVSKLWEPWGMRLPSEIMIHQPLGGAQGQATDIQISAQRIILMKERLNKMLAKNTGQKYAKIVKDTERDNFMLADIAKEYGLVDKVL